VPPITSLPGKAVGAVAGNVAGTVAGNVVEQFANACKSGADWVIGHWLTKWLDSPDPSLAANSPAAWLSGELKWLVAAVLVASVFIACMRIALSGRYEPGRDLAGALVRTVLVAAAGAGLVTAAVQAGDAFAHWILSVSHADVPKTAALDAVAFEPGLVILLGVVVMLTQFIQFVLMLARNAMIVLVVATLPLAAAGSATPTGRARWSKAVAWLAAFVLYKPTAATIYALSFKMTSRGQDDTTLLTGLALMILAVFALPGLLKLTMPATTALASGNAGAIAGSMVAGTLATGAMLAGGALRAAETGATRLPTMRGPSGAVPTGGTGSGGGGVSRLAAGAAAAKAQPGKGSGGPAGISGGSA
jgi:hypothetical protein